MFFNFEIYEVLVDIQNIKLKTIAYDFPDNFFTELKYLFNSLNIALLIYFQIS